MYFDQKSLSPYADSKKFLSITEIKKQESQETHEQVTLAYHLQKSS